MDATDYKDFPKSRLCLNTVCTVPQSEPPCCMASDCSTFILTKIIWTHAKVCERLYNINKYQNIIYNIDMHTKYTCARVYI